MRHTTRTPMEAFMAARKTTAQSKVKKTMHERKHGTLRSGSGKKVKSRKQAIAIGLNEARKSGAKVPPKKGSSRKSASKKSASRKSPSRKSASRKSSSRKTSSRKSSGRKSSG